MPHLDIEVVLALAESQFLEGLSVTSGTTAGEALAQSKIASEFPQYADEKTVSLGIFGRKIKPDHVLGTGDRIEIYRSLIADPKENRKKRAGKKKGHAED